MCYLKIAANEGFHWLHKNWILKKTSEADTCVSFIFPLANMELSVSDSQGWWITFFSLSSTMLKLWRHLTGLPPVAHEAVAWWSLLQDSGQSFTRFARVWGAESDNRWARLLFLPVVLFLFKLHLLLSNPNIFIIEEIKHVLMLWHLGW